MYLQKRLLLLCFTAAVFLFLTSCDKKKKTDCLPAAAEREKFSLKTVVDTKKYNEGSVVLKRSGFESFDDELVSAAIADSALDIASRIFNSAAFRANMSTLDFSYENHCKDCGSNASPRTERIPGSVVLDSIYRKPVVSLKLAMRSGRCKGALGSTCPDFDHITSNYKAIKCDMGDLPFVYAYAVHICHEYLHIAGFCHTDHKDDVAEKTGWIAYYIVKEWLKNKTP